MINAILGFYLIYHLDPKEFGLYSVSSDFINMVSLGVLSIFTNATQRFLAEYRGKGETEKISGILFFSLTYFLVFGLLMFIFFSIFSEKLATLFLKDISYAYAIRLYSFGVPFMALSLYLASVLYGFGKFKEVSISDIILPTISRAIFLFLFLPIYPSKIFIAVNSLNLKFFANFVSNLFVSYKILKEHIFGKRSYEFKTWFNYAFPLWLKYLLSLMQNNLKAVIVGASLGALSGGIFKAAGLISSAVFILEVSISSVIFVEMSGEFGRKGILNAALRVREITPKVVTVMGIFSILSSILGISVLRIIGRGYEVGDVTLAVMVLGYYVNSISGIWQAALQSFGRSDMIFLISLAYAILDIFIAILLIGPLGITGAALSFPISAFFITIVRLYMFKIVSGINPLSQRSLNLALIFSIFLMIVIFLAQIFT